MMVGVAKTLLVLVLSSFVIVTAVSFLRVRVKKKEEQFKNITQVLGLADEETRLFTPTVRDEYAPWDYVLPVAFATLVCLCGFITFLFGADLVAIHPGKANLVLTASRMDADPKAMELMRLQSMVVISLAFIGAFIWSAREMIRRLISGDLTPSVYYSAGLRMIFAALLSLMLSFLLDALPFPGYTARILPVVAFLTGMLPEQALVYLREKIPVFAPGQDTAAELPLDMIEGINAFHKVRLAEVGIDNAQNLAEANVIELLLKTPFNAAQLIDWIAQAKLYVAVKTDIGKLRRVGIRTIFDFKRAGDAPDRLAQVAQEVGVSGLALTVVYAQVAGDRGIERLQEFRTLLGTLGESRQ
jgi:hypothetical protein